MSSNTNTIDERKPWVPIPNACVVPGVIYDPRARAYMVSATYAANAWLATFCERAREHYPMGGPA